MFKKGQLVRSRKYRDLYVVDTPVNERGLWWVRPVSEKRLYKQQMLPEEILELIGNNYKAK